MNVKVIIIAVTIHILCTYYVHLIGNSHYHPSKSIKRKLDKVWDLCHKKLPNYHHLDFIVNIMVMSLFIIAMTSNVRGTIINDILTYFPLIVIVRSIMILVTILPKHKHCDSNKLSWHSFILGHCYDKIFSGHFSFILLLTLSMLRHNVTSKTFAISITILNAFLLLSTRSHYTNDIIVAFFVTYGIYNNCYALP